MLFQQILEKYPAEVLRFFVFSTHYRTPLDFSEVAMKDAESGLDRLNSCLAEISQLPEHGDSEQKSVAGKKNVAKITSLSERFVKAMDNDFNSAQALGHIFDAIKALNAIKQALPNHPAESDLALLHTGAKTIRELTAIMGLLKKDPKLYIQEKQDKIINQLDISRTEIDNLLMERTKAREEKNWARADEIRDELLVHNIEIKDGSDGTTWQVKI